MLVKINRGPRFGEEVHLPISQETNLAILLGDVVPIDRSEQQPAAPPAPLVPTYVARIGPRSGKPEIVCFYGSSEEYFTGSPDQTEGIFGGRARRSPTPEVVEQYRAVIAKQKAHSADRLGRY
jgi:hypothetical protein